MLIRRSTAGFSAPPDSHTAVKGRMMRMPRTGTLKSVPAPSCSFTTRMDRTAASDPEDTVARMAEVDESSSDGGAG